MKRKTILRKALYFVPITLLIILVAFSSFYTYWNTASPSNTCASCHEIKASVASLYQSSHRNLNCKECHGTALSNGMHSLKEKGMMVVHHLGKPQTGIGLNEDQLFELMNNCKRCHASEYAKWTSGGHSVNYKAVFLNQQHNAREQLNPDCLRCHGMFFSKTIKELVNPLDKTGPWNFLNPLIADKPAIPCMACHQVHGEGVRSIYPENMHPDSIFYQRPAGNTKVSFYDRHEHSFVPAENLPQLILWDTKKPVKVSDEPIMRNCIQCHAPNAKHEAGTGDDHTPRGVHEGISCIACHENHSNNARNSCKICHPAISNCKLDVTKMNTSYSDAHSSNNIHTLACTNCHLTGMPILHSSKP